MGICLYRTWWDFDDDNHDNDVDDDDGEDYDDDDDDLSKRWKQPSSFSPKLSLYPTVLDVRAELMLSSSANFLQL